MQSAPAPANEEKAVEVAAVAVVVMEERGGGPEAGKRAAVNVTESFGQTRKHFTGGWQQRSPVSLYAVFVSLHLSTWQHAHFCYIHMSCHRAVVAKG